MQYCPCTVCLERNREEKQLEAISYAAYGGLGGWDGFNRRIKPPPRRINNDGGNLPESFFNGNSDELHREAVKIIRDTQKEGKMKQSNAKDDKKTKRHQSVPNVLAIGGENHPPTKVPMVPYHYGEPRYLLTRSAPSAGSKYRY
eukprot:1166597-Rhodomonas_salina.1